MAAGINYEVVGENIKYYRKKKGTNYKGEKFTQAKLAKWVGKSVGYISSVEQGRKKPSLEFLATLAEALDCDVTDLLVNAMYKYYS